MRLVSGRKAVLDALNGVSSGFSWTDKMLRALARTPGSGVRTYGGRGPGARYLADLDAFASFFLNPDAKRRPRKATR